MTPMRPWLLRLPSWWRKIFFWQAPRGSQEFKPETHHDHALVVSVTEPKRLPRWRQVRSIPRVLTPLEQRVFWGSLAIFGITVLVGTMDLIRPHLMRVATVGGTLTEAVVGAPKLINPLYAPLNDVDRDLTALIFSGLFQVNDRLESEPDLAESYHWSADGKTLDIVLRKDARFHDGEPVTADDVVFTYQAVRDPSWRSPLVNTYRHLTIERVDDFSVRFHLDQPNPQVLMDLTLGILPVHIWGDVAGQNAPLAEANFKPIGSGPYRADSFKRDSKGVLLTYSVINVPNYYGTRPSIANRVFHFYPDRVQAQAALQGNQVDALAFVPWNDADGLARGNLQSVTMELPQETIAFFNVKDPTLKDTRLRQALALAINRKELQELIGPHATMVDSPFPFLATSTATEGNLETARSLLASLGWTLKPGTTVRTLAPVGRSSSKASSTELLISIDVPQQTDLISVAELLKRRWSLLGAKVHVHVSDAENLLQRAVTKRDYQVLIWNVLLPPTQDLSAFWSSDQVSNQGLNLSNLADHDVDAALATLKITTSTESLERTRVRVAKAILDKTPALFLLRPAYAYLIPKTVRGVTDARISKPSDRLLRSGSWYLKNGWRWK